MTKVKTVRLISGVALALAGALATTSPAVAGNGTGTTGPTTLFLTDTTTSTFGFPLTPTAGETFGEIGTIAATANPGTVIGSYSLSCTVVYVDTSADTITTYCATVQELTSGPYGTGKISTQGTDTGPTDSGPLTFTDIVTGGTGAFNAVGGSAHFTTPSEGTKNSVLQLTYPNSGRNW